MTLLLLGVLIWCAAHLFKRVLPAARLGMGDKARGPVALAILISVVLMVIGYRMADIIPAYTPIAGMGHANNLLMLLSVFFFGITPSKGVLADKIRHPMLWGVVVWAGAHLLTNGDVASLILFGGLGAWAVGAMILINRAGPWDRPPQGSLKGDGKNLVITAVIYGVAIGIHLLLGHSPFLGTYA